MTSKLTRLCLLTIWVAALGCTGTSTSSAPADTPPTNSPPSNSPTADSPPEGFVELFNGQDLSGWRYDDSGHWRAEDGLLVYDGGGWQPAPNTEFKRNLHTEQEYGDFVLLIDWKIEKDGNSGIFLRAETAEENSLQVEIWDRTAEVYSSPLGSGGIVGYTDKQRVPLRTVDNPLGEWNHFEIRVENNFVTVLLNDQLVLDGFAANFSKPKGPIVLQHHGSPLWFKNVYIKELGGDQ